MRANRPAASARPGTVRSAELPDNLLTEVETRAFPERRRLECLRITNCGGGTDVQDVIARAFPKMSTSPVEASEDVTHP